MGEAGGLVQVSVLRRRGQTRRALEQTDSLGSARRLDKCLQAAGEIVRFIAIGGEALGHRTQGFEKVGR